MARRNPYQKFLKQEDHLQMQICWYLRSQYPKVIWVHPPNEGRRTKFEQYLMKQLGAKPGASDLLILHPNDRYHGFAMEIKVVYKSGKKNYPTDHQRAFLRGLYELGYCTAIVWTFDEARLYLDQYMKGNEVKPDQAY